MQKHLESVPAPATPPVPRQLKDIQDQMGPLQQQCGVLGQALHQGKWQLEQWYAQLGNMGAELQARLQLDAQAAEATRVAAQDQASPVTLPAVISEAVLAEVASAEVMPEPVVADAKSEEPSSPAPGVA